MDLSIPLRMKSLTKISMPAKLILTSEKERPMEKFIPFEKLSKQKKSELLAKKRRTWGAISPVTRKPENPKAYKRVKARKWREDTSTDVPFTQQ
jgi:hypothetical protein